MPGGKAPPPPAGVSGTLHSSGAPGLPSGEMGVITTLTGFGREQGGGGADGEAPGSWQQAPHHPAAPRTATLGVTLGSGTRRSPAPSPGLTKPACGWEVAAEGAEAWTLQAPAQPTAGREGREGPERPWGPVARTLRGLAEALPLYLGGTGL